MPHYRQAKGVCNPFWPCLFSPAPCVGAAVAQILSPGSLRRLDVWWLHLAEGCLYAANSGICFLMLWGCLVTQIVKLVGIIYTHILLRPLWAGAGNKRWRPLLCIHSHIITDTGARGHTDACMSAHWVQQGGHWQAPVACPAH